MKGRQRVPQRRRRAAHPQEQPAKLNGAPVDFSRAVYLEVRHATQYLDLPTEDAFYKFVARKGVPKYSVGRGARGLRFRRRDLDAAVATAAPVRPRARKHSITV